MEKQIELGDTVQCIYTGFKGTAVSRTLFINGCTQIAVIPTIKDDKSMLATMPEEVGIDIQSLKVIKKAKKVIKRKEVVIDDDDDDDDDYDDDDDENYASGGPMKRNLNHRNF